MASDFDATRQRPWPELYDLAAAVKDGDRVLDLGCGNGRLLKVLPKVNFDYQGYDANEQLLAAARRLSPRSKFDKASLPDFPVAAGHYDHIFVIATFHHLVDRQERLALLKNIKQSLKPGGRLIMTNWYLWQPRYLKYWFSKLNKKIAWNDLFIPWQSQPQTIWRYYHAFTAKELNQLLQQAGFHNIEPRGTAAILTPKPRVYQRK